MKMRETERPENDQTPLSRREIEVLEEGPNLNQNHQDLLNRK